LPKRSALPELPTLQKSGVAGYEFSSWYGGDYGSAQPGRAAGAPAEG